MYMHVYLEDFTLLVRNHNRDCTKTKSLWWTMIHAGVSLKGGRVALYHSTCIHFPLMWSKECVWSLDLSLKYHSTLTFWGNPWHVPHLWFLGHIHNIHVLWPPCTYVYINFVFVGSTKCVFWYSFPQLGGPIWAEAIHDVDFVRGLLSETRDSPKGTYNTIERINGLLSVVSEVRQVLTIDAYMFTKVYSHEV